MLNERRNAVQQVHRELVPAEEAIDQALHQLGTLMTTMCVARTSAHLPIHTAQAEFDDVTAAVALLGQARSKILNAHRSMAITRGELIPNPRMWGDVGGCPPGTVSATVPMEPTLRVA